MEILMPEEKPTTDLDIDKWLAEMIASMGDVDLDHMAADPDTNPRSTVDLKLRLKKLFADDHDRYQRAADFIGTRIAEEPHESPYLDEMLKKQTAIRRVLDQIQRI
jgi:hypothetical protein